LQFPLRYPGYAAGIVRRAKSSTGGAAQVIHQHVVILGDAISIEHDPLIDFEQAEDLDFEPRLFANLAPQGVFKPFACFHGASWKRPPVLEGLAAPFDQEDVVAFDDESPDAEYGAFGILAANIATLPWRPL
jgi:hypothetical protein